MKIIKRYWFDFILMILWIGCGITVAANGSASVVAYICLLFCYLVEMVVSIMYKELIHKYKESKEKYNVE